MTDNPVSTPKELKSRIIEITKKKLEETNLSWAKPGDKVSLTVDVDLVEEK